MSIQSVTVSPRAFKKALVYYYMPGCPYCREFEPVFLELLHLCRKARTLSLHAVDITQHHPNGLGNVQVQSVPTVYYFDELGHPIKLQASSREERTLPQLASFLVKNHLKDYYHGEF